MNTPWVAIGALALSVLAGCATNHGPAFRGARDRADMLALTGRHVEAGQRMVAFADKMEPGSYWRATSLLSAADFLAAGEARGAAMTALNECITMTPKESLVRSTQHLCTLKRNEFLQGQYPTKQQLEQRIVSDARRRRADEAEDEEGLAGAPPVALPPMVIGTPAVGVPGPGVQMPSDASGRSMARNYCVPPAYSWRERGGGRHLHVIFKNNCPIAVKVGWCEQKADGGCGSGGGSPEIAPGGSYETTFTGRDAVRARYIACSATSAGYNTSRTLTEWYCARDR